MRFFWDRQASGTIWRLRFSVLGCGVFWRSPGRRLPCRLPCLRYDLVANHQKGLHRSNSGARNSPNNCPKQLPSKTCQRPNPPALACLDTFQPHRSTCVVIGLCSGNSVGGVSPPNAGIWTQVRRRCGKSLETYPARGMTCPAFARSLRECAFPPRGAEGGETGRSGDVVPAELQHRIPPRGGPGTGNGTRSHKEPSSCTKL